MTFPHRRLSSRTFLRGCDAVIALPMMEAMGPLQGAEGSVSILLLPVSSAFILPWATPYRVAWKFLILTSLEEDGLLC